MGMPGAFPGRVVSLHSARSIDEATIQVNPEAVREMISRGMTALTGDEDGGGCLAPLHLRREMWWASRSTAPARRKVCSDPESSAEIVRNLVAIGVKAKNIYIYERFDDQLRTVNYAKYLPAGRAYRGRRE